MSHDAIDITFCTAFNAVARAAGRQHVICITRNISILISCCNMLSAALRLCHEMWLTKSLGSSNLYFVFSIIKEDLLAYFETVNALVGDDRS